MIVDSNIDINASICPVSNVVLQGYVSSCILKVTVVTTTTCVQYINHQSAVIITSVGDEFQYSKGRLWKINDSYF